MLLQVICAILIFPAFLACCYYWFLALYSLKKRRPLPPAKMNIMRSFAIVIPAHNEEKAIVTILNSCKKLSYPNDKYKVYVIVDNCSDHTAEIAKNNGAECMIRNDETYQGKGYALAWAFDQILQKQFDAVVVLDADCLIDAQALEIFNQYLENEYHVLQATILPSNPDSSVISYVLSVGNIIEKDLFYSPKSQLGMTVFLQGTGMVFHRSILEQYEWRAHSIAEDVEYTIHLLRNNIPIQFINETYILSEFPCQLRQLNIQRMRWARGNFNASKKHALNLMLEGCKKKQWILFDAGWTLFILSRPLIASVLFIANMVAILCIIVSPDTFSLAILTICFVSLLSYCFYFLFGIAHFGITIHRMKFLLYAPVVVLKLIVISLLSLQHKGNEHWIRTPR